MKWALDKANRFFCVCIFLSCYKFQVFLMFLCIFLCTLKVCDFFYCSGLDEESSNFVFDSVSTLSHSFHSLQTKEQGGYEKYRPWSIKLNSIKTSNLWINCLKRMWQSGGQPVPLSLIHHSCHYYTTTTSKKVSLTPHLCPVHTSDEARCVQSLGWDGFKTNCAVLYCTLY